MTLPALANVGGLLILFLYIYSIMGVFLFAEVKIEAPLHDNVNFENVAIALLTLFRIATGENWHELLHGLTRSN